MKEVKYTCDCCGKEVEKESEFKIIDLVARNNFGGDIDESFFTSSHPGFGLLDTAKIGASDMCKKCAEIIWYKLKDKIEVIFNDIKEEIESGKFRPDKK